MNSVRSFFCILCLLGSLLPSFVQGKELQATIRSLDSEKIARIRRTIVDAKTIKVFMRHGAQRPSEKAKYLSGAPLKIRMMQHPDNFNDGLTEESLGEAQLAAQTWKALLTNHKLKLYSSENKRALAVSEKLAGELNTDLNLLKSLNCIDYPVNEILEKGNLSSLYLDSKGGLPWKEENVNALTADREKGTYTRIVNDMKKLKDNQESAIYVSHTQQINAIQDHFQLPPERLGNLGFILIVDDQAYIYSKGFF